MGKRGVRRVLRREFERRYDADVTGYVYLDELGLEAEGRVWHVPSEWLATLLALRRLRLESDDVVADVGAGKGMAVLLAGSMPVSRVIGVELADKLAETARANVARNSARMRAEDVEIVTADALEWEIPDDLTVVYLYSPFYGDVFGEFLRRLFAAYDAHPRPLRIVYNFPFEHNRLLATGRVRVLDVTSAIWPRLPRWWMREFVVVTYGIGAGPFPPQRGLRPPSSAMRRWSGPNDARLRLERPGRPTVWSQ